MNKDFNEEITQLEEMRLARESANSIFIKFTSNNKYFSTHAFCFFEGEDGKYYNSRVRQYYLSEFISYKVGSKNEVLKLMNKIKSDGAYDSVNKMFFIDRDYDISLKDTDDDLYETPCYSIENLYAQRSCFKQILQSEFGLNITDDDYYKCIKDFDIRFNEFNEGMVQFNALVLLRRKKSDSNSNFQFGNVKTNNLFLSSIQSVSRSTKYDDTIKKIIDALQFNEAEIEEAKNEILKIKSYEENYRGKNQLDFMVSVLKSLKELNNNAMYFKEKLKCVSIDITSNRLSELSQYAVTPECLQRFLISHRFSTSS